MLQVSAMQAQITNNDTRLQGGVGNLQTQVRFETQPTKDVGNLLHVQVQNVGQGVVASRCRFPGSGSSLRFMGQPL